MTELCVIRHGETEWNVESRVQGRTDNPLNSKGRKQAYEAAGQLANEHWDLVYSSPLKRAYETAEIILKAVGLNEIIIENDLIEFDFGGAEGLDMAKRKSLYPDRDMIPGAERMVSFRNRAEQAITDISEKHEDKRIIIVSHACFIMEILEIFSYGKINGRKTKLENLSTSLLVRDSEWEIPWYNKAVLEIDTENRNQNF